MAKAKKGKVKIPKHIGGVKIPKELRKAANRAIETLSEHPVLSDLVASGLVAAAAALTRDKMPERQDAPPDEGDGAARDAVGKDEDNPTRS